jgi:hypothetical protein
VGAPSTFTARLLAASPSPDGAKHAARARRAAGGEADRHLDLSASQALSRLAEKAQRENEVAKTWKHLTQADKIEDLRGDVVDIFGALKKISSDVDDLRARVSEVAKNLDSLSTRTKEADPSRP